MSALTLPLLALMLIWIVYTVTTYALPCLAGLVAATYALETGSGWFGACVVFGLTAITVFGLMRWLFALSHIQRLGSVYPSRLSRPPWL